MNTYEKTALLIRWGIPAAQIARRAGLDKSTISKWQKGTITITKKTEAQIAEVIQFYIDQLHNVLELLEGAESAINNQSTLSTLQTAKNGEAT